MKKYIIYGCERRGIFICNESKGYFGINLLTGHFEGEVKQYDFAKSKNDIELIN